MSSSNERRWLARGFAGLFLAVVTVLALGILVPAFAQVPTIDYIRCPDGKIIPNDGSPCPDDNPSNGGGGGSTSGATPASIAIAAAAGAAVIGGVVGAVKKSRARVPTTPSVEHVPTYPRGSGHPQQLQRVHGRGSYEWETPAAPPNFAPAQLIGDASAAPQRLYTGSVSSGAADPPPVNNTVKDVKSVTPDPIKALHKEIDQILHQLDDSLARGQITPQEHHARSVAVKKGLSMWLPAAEAAVAAGAAGYVATSVTGGADVRFCPACGTERGRDGNYCRKCGRAFA
jgi:hypothetical protein